MKKIGFFGGSFDPLHFGHLNLAISLSEYHHLDQVLFCPVNRSPFKERDPIASGEHRLAMTKLAIQGLPHFQLCNLEIKRGGVSYTVDTLRALKGEQGELFFLLTEEAMESFPRWKESEEIMRLAKPLIGTRQRGQGLAGLTPMPVMEISSTKIRDRLKKNLPCPHLVPAIVLDYIRQQGLY